MSLADCVNCWETPCVCNEPNEAESLALVQKLTDEMYLNFELNEDKKAVHLYESLDYYNDTQLTKKEILTFSSILKNLAELMKD